MKLEYDFEAPQRGQIVVFNAPAAASVDCRGDGGSTFVKRLIGLPGETVHENGQGFISVEKPGAKTWVRLTEPYVTRQGRLSDISHFHRTWPVRKASTS